MEYLQQEGFLVMDTERIVATKKGKSVLDSILPEIYK
jgi:hypothetical protein